MNLFAQALVLGSEGHFGRIFVRKLRAAGMLVHGADLHEVGRHADLNGSYWSMQPVGLDATVLAQAACCDCVLACIPEDALIAVMPQLAEALPAEALLIDIASVKSRIAAAHHISGLRAGHLGLHPMFAPLDDFSGRAMAVVELRANARSSAFERIVAGWGAQVTRLDAQSHDRTMAAIQVLPHAALLAFGSVLCNGAVPFESIWSLATPIQKTMLGLLLRVAGRDQLTHYAIQAENPYAKEIRAQLGTAVEQLSAGIDTPGPQNFVASLRDIATFINPADFQIQAIAERIVEFTRQELGNQ
ncbi:MAG: prephenate dehydrogenase/arogenate dehydrogenase family protein [Pseudorhodoferax sp.]